MFRMNLRQLRTRAVEEGVSPDKIEDARDGDDPKEDLVQLIMGAAVRSSLNGCGSAIIGYQYYVVHLAVRLVSRQAVASS